MIYSEADLKLIKLTKAELKDREKVVSVYEPILTSKVIRQIEKIFYTIKQNGNVVDETSFHQLVEGKWSHIKAKDVVDSYYNEQGVELISTRPKNVKEEDFAEDHFDVVEEDEQQTENDIPFKNYAKKFGHLTLDKQIVELFSIYLTIYYGQQYGYKDEDEYRDNAIEFWDLTMSLILAGWPIYEGLHILSKAILDIIHKEDTIVTLCGEKVHYDATYLKDIVGAFMWFARDIEEEVYSYFRPSDDLEGITVFEMEQNLVQDFSTMLEQYREYQQATDDEEKAQAKEEYDNFLNEYVFNFSRLYGENRKDVLQVVKAKLDYFKDIMEIQSFYLRFEQKPVYDEEVQSCDLFPIEDNKQTINYLESLLAYLEQIDMACKEYGKRKWVVKKTTVLSAQDVMDMAKEYHLDHLEMFGSHYDEYVKDSTPFSYDWEETVSDIVS